MYTSSIQLEIKYHYIKDMVDIGEVNLQYVATDEQIAHVLTKQLADMLTMPLARMKFEYFREKLGVLQIEVPSKRK